jgi:hypothetical protein
VLKISRNFISEILRNCPKIKFGLMAGILPYSLTNRSPLFNKSVDKLFNNWTALDVSSCENIRIF